MDIGAQVEINPGRARLTAQDPDPPPTCNVVVSAAETRRDSLADVPKFATARH
ncbi:hypothetical protein [Mycobacteroides abscessus]|uniref:hypothetical protein n=1 Tax=Mycobacteroides abscessus TaxID=36809 RepID=UPI0003029656|nr:hypothetical protein [Mycobacteroides abscessus]MBL3746459.1 hypothetical protein [Mycobacteroides abscessus subsp. massiliense]MBL3762473.1 hypothetical protein [Mycobacteroides abscessus subsp. massiliense]MBN7481354.1 hypothetical protein [Mycobacteroides abscessus subsp. massiliense]MDB2217181.1 hypothetical protein [Mycobacteroides abscessus subsp. massiliense]MDM2105711.1 hypothetical protein [Mycobacteroides abscessus]